MITYIKTSCHLTCNIAIAQAAFGSFGRYSGTAAAVSATITALRVIWSRESGQSIPLWCLNHIWTTNSLDAALQPPPKHWKVPEEFRDRVTLEQHVYPV
jgi:hypothetical protein